MPNPFFSFKKFTIHHDRCAMKVGTDGVLLGCWVKPNPSNVLRTATGSPIEQSSSPAQGREKRELQNAACRGIAPTARWPFLRAQTDS